MSDRLIWTEEDRKIVYTCSIFNVEERFSRSPVTGKLKTFNALTTPEWAIIVPVLETEQGNNFVMVRQWRHGARELSLEFTGGVFEMGENPQEAAIREMREETGYTAHRIEKLGEFNPNPAIMTNKVHFFLAYDLDQRKEQELDEEEYADVEIVPFREVLAGMGKPPFIHALMGTAMCLYLQRDLKSRV